MNLLSRIREKICKSIVGIDASQLYPFSLTQPMPTGLYTRWEYDTVQNLKDSNLNRTNLESLRTWLCHISKEKDPTVKFRVYTLHEISKRLIVSR